MLVRLTVTRLTIAAALLVLATTLSAEAQQAAKGSRIGVLWGGSPGPDRRLEAFRTGLRELGYVEGENVTILHRFAEGRGVYNDAALNEVREAAYTLRMEPQFLGVRGPEVLGADFRLSDAQRGLALLVLSDAVLFAHRSRVVDLAAKSRLPAVYTHSGWVEAGGLMSYGTDFADMLRRAAYFVDKIVRGAKPADLPIEQPTKFELVINKKTAHALGLTIPSALLVRADQIVE